MFNLSKQANILLVLLIIQSIFTIIITFVTAGFWGFLYMFLHVIFLGPIIVFIVYSIDCLTSGGCNILSWLYTTMYSLSIIISLIWMIILGILSVFMKEKLVEETEEK